MKLTTSNTKRLTRIEKGMQQAVQFLRGEISLRVTEFDDPPPEMTPSEIINLRQKRKMSQAKFARFLNVSPKTVQSWEQGTREPSRATLRLLQILSAKPKSMRRSEAAGKSRKKTA
jgi:DNA-binding transcriptional regulator YiaG